MASNLKSLRHCDSASTTQSPCRSCRNVVARTVSFQIIADVPQGRIQQRTSFVEFGLAVSAAPAFAADARNLSCRLLSHHPIPRSECVSKTRWTRQVNADDELGVCSMFSSLTNPLEQIQWIQHRILLAIQQMLWMWSGSFMVPRPFWIQLCVHGLKTHVLSTSNGPQSLYNKAPVATGGSMI